MNDFIKKNEDTKKILNDISTSFCLAKWTQTTIHLGLGHTHSCHHPRTHKIPVESLKKNPSSLHNTDYKKNIREQMLTGVRPAECEYCWKVEDLEHTTQYSDRILKSSYDWSMPFLNEVLDAGSKKNINPKYLEISFSNVCNFKCSYCMPSVSSQWMEEIEKYGPYPTSMKYNNLDWVKVNDKMPILSRQSNPYIDAFWEWFPDLIGDLHTFRITGGEPLLDKNTFKVLDYIIDNPQPNLELSINSNFDVPAELFEKFLIKCNIIAQNKLVKLITTHTSCEAYGKSAEYIRHGMSYDNWKKNVIKYIDNVHNPHLGIMSTYNCLSVTSYKNFLQDVLFFKKCINKNNGYINLDIPYLNHPYHLSVKILTNDFIDNIENQIKFCIENSIINQSIGFNEQEISKLIRIKELFQHNSFNDFDLITARKDFIQFINEHDKRRNTVFLSSFPELTNFYNLCSKL